MLNGALPRGGDCSYTARSVDGRFLRARVCLLIAELILK